MTLFRKKPIVSPEKHVTSLYRCLMAYDLIFLGIGTIIGAGVFVLTGVAAATKAGPAVSWIRFVIWMVIGIGIYFCYSRKHSVLNYTLLKHT